MLTLPKKLTKLTRCKVSAAGHDWITARLVKWQTENGVGAKEKPPAGTWYQQTYRECLKAGHLSPKNSEDVVRSWVKHYISKLP